MSDLFRPTKIVTGTRRVPVRPPRTVRPPTEKGQASLSGDFECTEDPFNTSGDDNINLPAGQPGDLGFIFASIWGSQSITGITGWTQIASSTQATGTSYVFYRIYDGTEGTTVAGTHSGDGRSNAIAIRLNANGVDFSVSPPEASIVGGINGTPDPPSHTPSTGAGTYFVFAGANAAYTQFETYDMISGYTDLGGCNDGSTSTRLGWALIDITTAEDPPAFPGASIGARNWNAWTVAVLQQPSSPPVASGDHTHTEADITNLDHWTETDHDALDHTGLTGVGGGSVNDLTDATITSVADNEVFAYDSGTAEWINQTAAEAGLSATGHTHTESDVTDLDHWTETDHDALDHSGLTGVGGGELLMQDGVTAPPVPIETEARDDWLYED